MDSYRHSVIDARTQGYIFNIHSSKATTYSHWNASFSYHELKFNRTPQPSGCPITQEPSLDGSTIEPPGLHGLRVTWDQVYRLIAPFDFFTIDVQNDALDGLLGLETNTLSILLDNDLETDGFNWWETNEFEWLWPGLTCSVASTLFWTSAIKNTYQFVYLASTVPSPSRSRAETTMTRGISLSLVLTG